MSGGMYLAAAGAMAQQSRLEVLANNIANIDTTGFKAERTVFRVENADEPAQAQETEGEIQPLSPYSPPFETRVDFSQGALHQTGNPLDVAISGNGFFSVQTPEGIQYTRQGSFSLNDQGALVTPDGYTVEGEGGAITIEAGTVDIDMTGGIFVDGDEVGRLKITEIDNPQTLKKTGNGRFMPTDATIAAPAPETANVSQGYLESANVSPILAMTEMIETTRVFEAYQKVIQSADEATQTSLKDIGKTS